MDVRHTQLNFAPSNSWAPPSKPTPYISTDAYRPNQLQFNLNVASDPSNLAVRFRKPGPLVIEKLGGGQLGAGVDTENATPKVSPLKFSAVSEDRLSLAIQLAKRDLKNQMRERQQQKLIEAAEAEEEAKAPKGKKKFKKGQTKTKKTLTGKVIATRQLPIRERGERAITRSVKTQTPPKKQYHTQRQSSDAPPHGLVLHLTPSQGGDDVGARRRRKDDAKTPPSRESRVDADSPMTRQAKEIKRLHQELKEYIDKIEQLSRQASQTAPRTKAEDSEADEEEAKRKAARTAEQARRSARLLYSLQQQVREIQEELERLGPGQIRHTKKSRAMNRLAAAHRGAVRVLQTFLHHLPEQTDADSGLPPLYQELALLIRQLSLCCAQLEIGDTGVPEGVLNILEQAKGLENALEQQLQSPARPTRASKPQTSPPRPSKTTHQQQASPRRRLAFDQPKSTNNNAGFSSQPHQIRVQSGQSRVTFGDRRIFDGSPSKDLPVRDTDLYHTQVPSTGERIRRNLGMDVATPGTPERTAIMRAGLQALLRAEGGNPASQPIRNLAINQNVASHPMRNPVTNTVGAQSSSQPIRAQSRKPVVKKRPLPSGRSLLLPAKLKADRERLQRSRAALKDAHFTMATKSSIAKQQPIKTAKPDNQEEPNIPPQAPKPAWTPRSFHKDVTPRKELQEMSDSDKESDEVPSARSMPRSPKSPRRLPRSKVHFKDDDDDRNGRMRGGLNAEMTEREVARQAWLDSEVSRRLHELDELRKAELTELEKLRAELTQPSKWIEDAEKAIKERLQPIINQAQDLSDTHKRNIHMASQSVGKQLSRRAFEKACSQGDLLSDLILEDILEDTAREMESLERRDDVDKQAQQMMDAPTVEGLLQTLDIMEAQEEAIRRRWRKVSYADSTLGRHQPHIQQTSKEPMNGVRDDWMTGTPLEGALLERLSENDIPQQHTSITVTNIAPSNNILANEASSKNPYSTTSDTRTRWAQKRNQPKNEQFSNRERYHESNATGQGYLHDGQSSIGASRTLLERPKFPLFVSTEAKKRIDRYRERFDRHLKRKSHETIGTFDPWSMVDELADEIVDEIIEEVTEQVGDIMSNCVDDLYKAEFDVTSTPQISQSSSSAARDDLRKQFLPDDSM